VKARPLGSSDAVGEKFARVVPHGVACPAIAHTADPAVSRLRHPLKSEHVTDTPPPDKPPEHEKSPLRRFEDAVHDRLLAAEVAGLASAAGIAGGACCGSPIDMAMWVSWAGGVRFALSRARRSKG